MKPKSKNRLSNLLPIYLSNNTPHYWVDAKKKQTNFTSVGGTPKKTFFVNNFSTCRPGKYTHPCKVPST